jgi:hypothetical protein
MVLLALVDARYRFLVVDIGGCGRMSDSSLFATAGGIGEMLNDGKRHTRSLLDTQNMPAIFQYGATCHHRPALGHSTKCRIAYSQTVVSACRR